jgi:signal transduction histidine kinase
VAWASHDLRTPVASLQAMIEAIEDGLIEPEEYTPVLRRQVRLLGSLVDDLFQLACLDAGATRMDLTTADLGSVVTECVARFAVDARAAGCSLETVVGPGSHYARCSPEHLERVLANLVDNALRHTPSGGSVTVAVERSGGHVELSVIDSGSGIAPEVASRIFEPFFRAEAARTGSAGNAGLGLAIARGLVEAQGGRIWVESSAGHGAHLRVMLSAAEPPPDLLTDGLADRVADPSRPASRLVDVTEDRGVASEVRDS